jgi:hypothetical protein
MELKILSGFQALINWKMFGHKTGSAQALQRLGL